MFICIILYNQAQFISTASSIQADKPSVYIPRVFHTVLTIILSMTICEAHGGIL